MAALITRVSSRTVTQQFRAAHIAPDVPLQVLEDGQILRDFPASQSRAQATVLASYRRDPWAGKPFGQDW
jgi:hypothetical protein